MDARLSAVTRRALAALLLCALFRAAAGDAVAQEPEKPKKKLGDAPAPMPKPETPAPNVPNDPVPAPAPGKAVPEGGLGDRLKGLRVVFSPDADGKGPFSANLPNARPNGTVAAYAYVENVGTAIGNVAVRLTPRAPGRPLFEAAANLQPAVKYTRLTFARAAAPAPAVPAVAPPAAPKDAPPVPPGVEVADDPRGVLDVTVVGLGTDSVVCNIDDIPVSPVPTLTPSPADKRLNLSVSFTPPADAAPPFVELSFPPQVNLDARGIGAGTLRGKLTPAFKLSAAALRPTGFPVRGFIDVEGVERRYAFDITGADASNIRLVTEDRIALDGPNPDPDTYSTYYVRSGATFPVRIRPTNATADAVLLRLDDAEIASLSARDRRFWIEPVGPDGAIQVSNRVSDHVVPIDTRGLSGTHTVSVARAGSNAKDIITLKIDGTAPDNLDIGLYVPPPPKVDPKVKVKAKPKVKPLPAGVVGRSPKAKPMAFKVNLEEPESRVTKVVFYVGKPDADGKLPPGLPSVEAEPLPKAARTEKDGSGDIWFSEFVPVPTDKVGFAYLTVVATNAVQLEEMKTIRVELVEPEPTQEEKDKAANDPNKPGKIWGKIVLAGRPQPKTTVLLLAADGKPTATAQTNDKGEYMFTNVKPGTYSVATKKENSTSTSRLAAEPVTVVPGKTSIVSLEPTR